MTSTLQVAASTPNMFSVTCISYFLAFTKLLYIILSGAAALKTFIRDKPLSTKVDTGVFPP